MKHQLALLASGSGTTAAEIWKAHQSGVLNNVVPRLLVTNKHDAGVIERMAGLGFPRSRMCVVPKHPALDDAAYGKMLLSVFSAFDITVVGQYGWLLKTPRNVIRAFDWGKRIINQHPAPVPWFGGKGFYGIVPHAAVLAYIKEVRRRALRDCRYTMVVSHRVTPQYDRGAVLCYRAVPICSSDTPEQLQKRALPAEWEVQIETLRRFGNDIIGVLPQARYVYPHEWRMLKEARHDALRQYARTAKERP